MKKEKLDVIIPIYNEEECINELIKRLIAIRKKMNYVDINLIFVNDGSKDKSLNLLYNHAEKNEFIKIINFSRNFGHQIAVTCGLDYTNADFVVIIDADLQDPPELIENMYKKAKNGYDIVYGQRIRREGETVFKKVTAKLFYKLMNNMCDVDIPRDTGDFRLINNKVLNALKSMKERHRFIRGMIPWVGFNSTPLKYNRDERYAGETKYPLIKMIKFAKDAIFSFSDKPLRIATYIGFITILIGLITLGVIVYLRLFSSYYVSGITAVITLLIILSGVQIMIMGIMGEYIGRIFEESKKRPLYFVDNTINIKTKNEN